MIEFSFGTEGHGPFLFSELINFGEDIFECSQKVKLDGLVTYHSPGSCRYTTIQKGVAADHLGTSFLQ